MHPMCIYTPHALTHTCPTQGSGVASAFPSAWRSKMKKKMKKNWGKAKENEETSRKFLILPTWGCESGYAPTPHTPNITKTDMKQTNQ